MTDTSSSEPPRPMRFNILSLDGGGIRGYSELLILDHILKQLRRVAKLETVPLPCEVFDLICGTSTGGLIALMLGRLRMKVEDALQCYQDFSQTIFGSKWPFRPILTAGAYTGLLLGRARYSAKVLEKCIKKVVANHDGKDAKHEDKDAVAKPDGNPDAPLQDPLDHHDHSNKLCRTFVVAAFNAAPAVPRRLNTYRSSYHDADDCKIWEAARATTAASTYFKPITMGARDQTYIDGGLAGANNPSRLALEAFDEAFKGGQIGCFLSLGTGVPPVRKWGSHVVTVGKSAIDSRTDSEAMDDELFDLFQEKAKKGETQGNVYFRFSVDNGLGTKRLDEWDSFGEVAAVTDAYMKRLRRKMDVDECVEKLKPKFEAEGQAMAQTA